METSIYNDSFAHVAVFNTTTKTCQIEEVIVKDTLDTTEGIGSSTYTSDTDASKWYNVIDPKSPAWKLLEEQCGIDLQIWRDM